MPDKNILKNFSEELTEDEYELLADYIKNPNFQILSDSFEKIVKHSNGSETKDNKN